MEHNDIYTRENTFLDFFADDLRESAVWFNSSEFARWHNLDGKKILAIFTGNIKNRTIEIHTKNSPEGLAKSSGVLFFRAKDIKGIVRAGSQHKLNGDLYTVKEARLIQDQVWRVVLEANS